MNEFVECINAPCGIWQPRRLGQKMGLWEDEC
jgi:hypothetical protein